MHPASTSIKVESIWGLSFRRIVVDVVLTCIDIDIRAAGGSTPLALDLLSNLCLSMPLGS